MWTETRRLVLSVVLTLTAAGAAWGQVDPFGPVGPKKDPAQEQKKELPKPPRPDEVLASLPFEVRQAEEMPGNLRGAGAIFPIGKKEFGFSAAIYVPSYYDPYRPWPVLMEGQSKRSSPLTLKELSVEAERHGFIALCVELVYYRADRQVSQSQAWSRTGGTTVTQSSRFLVDFLTDMAEDEKNIAEVMKEVARKYNVASEAAGTTGFLGASLMSYRMVCKRPDLFSVAISRSGNFLDKLLPDDFQKARRSYIFIVCGEKEEAGMLAGSNAAAEFFRANNFSRLQIERIPNSGVDSRPEIVGNYFRGAFEEILGPEKSEFFRVHRMAMQCLEGVKDVSVKEPVKADADKRDDKKTSEEKGTEEAIDKPAVKLPAPAVVAAPATPAAAMASLSQFDQQYPQSAFRGAVRFLMARVAAEKLEDKARAETLLREFVDPPLASSPLTPAAVLYLVERVIDQDARLNEAIQWLGKTMNRREAPAEIRDRTRELRKTLLQRRGGGQP